MRIGSPSACATFRKSLVNYAMSGPKVTPISAPVLFVLLLALFGLIGAAMRTGRAVGGPDARAGPSPMPFRCWRESNRPGSSTR